MKFSTRSLLASILLGIALLGTALPARAELGSAMPATSQILLQVCGALALVVSLIVLAGWLAKRSKLLGYAQGRELSLIANLNLGKKEKLVLVNACGKKLLLGVSSHNISLLCDDWEQQDTEGLSVQDKNKHTDAERDASASKKTSGADKADFSSFLKSMLVKNVETITSPSAPISSEDDRAQ